MDDIMKAAKEANAYNFIMDLPQVCVFSEHLSLNSSDLCHCDYEMTLGDGGGVGLGVGGVGGGATWDSSIHRRTGIILKQLLMHHDTKMHHLRPQTKLGSLFIGLKLMP